MESDWKFIVVDAYGMMKTKLYFIMIEDSSDLNYRISQMELDHLTEIESKE